MPQTTPKERSETIVERNVTYTLQMNGKLYVVENVPARVVVETGEELFSPETVERIHRLIRGEKKPARVVETPVFDFA